MTETERKAAHTGKQSERCSFCVCVYVHVFVCLQADEVSGEANVSVQESAERHGKMERERTWELRGQEEGWKDGERKGY